jgi:hypothetical protein
MSFWKTLEHDLVIVGKEALALAPLAGAAVSIVNPVAGALITGIAGRITASITSVEQTITDAKAGVLKAATVKADFDNALALAEEISGDKFTYDPAAFQSVLDAQVSALNAMAAFKQTVKKQ